MSLGLTSTTKNSIQNEDLKRLLLETLKTEKIQMTGLVEALSSEEVLSNSSSQMFCKKVIEAIDRIIKAGNWEDSLFLHNTVKPLKQIRDQAVELLEQLTGISDIKSFELAPLPENYVALYISIFQNDGLNLRKWELQLRSINSHLMGRAVYQNEEDVKTALRTRLTPMSEGYIVVGVDKKSILSDPMQPTRKDRHGKLLLTLKPNAVDPEYIREFVHLNRRYFFIKGKLIAQSGAE